MKVQRFYKRGDKSVYYDLPYAEDEYTLYAEGSAIVTYQNWTWVLATNSTGSYSTPKGMSIEDLLKPFNNDKEKKGTVR